MTHRVKSRTETRIVRIPGICGGEPTVKGTRIPVRIVVVAYQMSGGAVSEVLEAYPSLDRSAVDEALAFYAANQQEIDLLIDENERAAYQTE